MDSWNGFHMIWKSPSIVWIIMYYGFIASTIWCLVRWKAASHAQREGVNIRFMLHSRGISLSVLCHLMGLFMLLWEGYHPEIWHNQGLVQFIDVGQGDAILIRTPRNKLILLDGGGTLVFHKQGDEWKQRKNPYEIGKNMLVPLLKKRGVHQLDYVIISHEHTDHIGGLQEVLEQIPVRHLIFNGTVNPNSSVTRLFRSALKLNIPLIVADESLVLSVDNLTTLRFLYPLKTDEHENNLIIEKNQNNQSLVFLLEMYSFHFLFTGDMEKISENKVLEHLKANSSQPPLINVLKMAHHGSKTSTTEAWLDYWQPKQAVISVGEHNMYGHPSKEVLTRLNQHEIELFRTDKHGEVDMSIKEEGIQSSVKFPN
jgi:competence protein ComEC